MAIKRYLAMTAAEIAANEALPPHIGYMACHFSPYGTGLCNLPHSLPEGSMLILNDRIPPRGHDPGLVARQLTETVEVLRCGCVLLDFQQPDCQETAELTGYLADALPCPAAVSEAYAAVLELPVFLPPIPPDVPPESCLQAWSGREIWLEISAEGMHIRLDPQGAAVCPLPYPSMPDECHRDEKLCCHYRIRIEENSASFTLFRTQEDLDALLAKAEAMGVTQAVGLWQEFQDGNI